MHTSEEYQISYLSGVTFDLLLCTEQYLTTKLTPCRWLLTFGSDVNHRDK